MSGDGPDDEQTSRAGLSLSKSVATRAPCVCVCVCVCRSVQSSGWCGLSVL